MGFSADETLLKSSRFTFYDIMIVIAPYEGAISMGMWRSQTSSLRGALYDR